MSDHIDRAAEVIARVGCQPGDEPSNLDWEYAQALADAGLLATPEREAVVAAKALREAVEAMRDCKRPGHWNLDAEPGSDTGYSPDVWLTKRADRIEREAGESDADA